ncbi:MAG: ABC transporter ATP-binding protein [Planctomycetes bacterium]|nr:ABC transporter ATP-binding protein [Planctomycetota bacterium]
MEVEIRRLGKSFRRVVALREVSMSLPAGSRTALIGPNGSGKSTLVRSILGMLQVDGEVSFDGVARQAGDSALAMRTAYVPQIAPRLAAPVREIVRAAAGLRGRSWSAVAAVAADLRLDLDALATRPFRVLSGGQRQKVLAALALASGAELMLFDEPTASMDPASRNEFFRLVEQLPGACTVLLCSHRLDEIRRLVDRVVVLEEGVVAWHGSADDYLARHAAAVVEVRVEGDAAAAWLTTNGFTAGLSGWWSRVLPAGQRAGIVADIGRTLEGQVRDLMARDVERLQSAEKDGRS